LHGVGGPVYIAELSDSVVSSANALHHAKIVRDKSVLRTLLTATFDIAERCHSAADADEVLNHSGKRILEIAQSQTSASQLDGQTLLGKVLNDLQGKALKKSAITGIPTHYDNFDLLTAGLQNSDLIVLAGRPSMGKTAFALNIALRAALRSEEPCAIFSLEMSMEQLMTRLIAVQSKVDLHAMRTGALEDEDWQKIYKAADEIGDASITIDDTPALTPLELQARCRRLKAEKGVGLVIVDYLQLMQSSRKNNSREQDISEISRSLKALAKELDVPVIALSQLNRKVEERTDKRPMMSDLRESGAIEQDADLIVFLYRDAAYNKSIDNPQKNIAEVIIAKQRNGPVGKCELFFQKEYTAFENISR